MGKNVRLRNTVELNLLLPLPTPDPVPAVPASLHRRTQSMALYCMVLVGSILNEDVCPPPPSYLGI